MLGQAIVSNVQLGFKSLLIGSHHVGLDSKTHACSHNILGFALPSVVLITILGTYMGLLFWSSAGRPAERVFVMGYLLTLVDNIIFSLVIPDSYGLVRKLGGEPYISGLVVGAFKLGTFFGAAVIFVLLRRYPKLWKDFARTSFLVCGLFSVVGTAAWLLVSWLVGGSYSLQNGHKLIALLLFGRVAGGIGAGIRLLLVRAQLSWLNPDRTRPARRASILFAIHVGMGLGPLIAGSARLMDNHFCPELADERYGTVGLTGFSLSLACLFAVLRLAPLDGVQEFNPTASSSSNRDDLTSAMQQVIIAGCLGFSILRAFVVSGAEVATSMLLEVEYQWHVAWISMAIGTCLLTCIPLNKWYSRCGTMLSVKSWVKLMLAVSMVGCLFYFRAPSRVLMHFDLDTRRSVEAFSLLFADVLVLPSFWLSDALSQGMMMNHVPQDGDSIFTSDNVNMLQVLLLDGLSRTVGPALARGQADLAGRNGYATQQTVLTGVAALLSLLVILRKVQDNGAPLVPGDEEDLKLSPK